MDRPTSSAIVCNICSKQFFSELNYSIHSRGHSSDGSSAKSTQSNPETSIESAGLSDPAEIRCENANDVNCQPNELSNAFNVQSESNVFSEPQHSLSAETTACNQSKDKGYTCGVCKGYFSSASTFKKHYLTHMKETEFPAGDNSKNSGTADNLNQFDIVTSHVNDQPVDLPSEVFVHTCKICQDKFSSKVELSVHSRSHVKKDTFSCSTCGKVFYRKATLAIHQSLHHVKESFSCETCKVEFSSKLLLSVHEQTHLLNKPLSCKVCPLTFPHKAALIEHYREHKLKKTRCEFCGERFSKAADLEKHLSIHLEDSMNESYINYSCNRCEKTFPFREMLRTHQMIHEGSVDVFPCGKCEKVFPTMKNLKMHENKVHEGIDERKYSCNVCGAKYMTKAGWRHHAAQHFVPDSQLSCIDCGEKFKSKDALWRHRRLKHKLSDLLSCSECPKKYATKKALVTHMQSHTDIRPFPCNVCGKSFHSIHNLSRHRLIHTGKKPHVCSICDKRFSRKDFLKLHIRRHMGEKPYMCEDCGFCYATSQGLKTHKARHAGDEPILHRKSRPPKTLTDEITVLGPNQCPAFTCNVCGKHLISERSYQNHMLKHEVEAVFKCDQCSTEFVSKTSLKNHIYRMHSANLPKNFVCSYCEKKFSSLSHLYRHQRVHTGEKKFECEICHKRFAEKVNLRFHIYNKVCLRNPKNVEKDNSESNE